MPSQKASSNKWRRGRRCMSHTMYYKFYRLLFLLSHYCNKRFIFPTSLTVDEKARIARWPWGCLNLQFSLHANAGKHTCSTLSTMPASSPNREFSAHECIMQKVATRLYLGHHRMVVAVRHPLCSYHLALALHLWLSLSCRLWAAPLTYRHIYFPGHVQYVCGIYGQRPGK